MRKLMGSKLMGALAVILVVILAMAFAAANAGHRVTLELGLFTLYRAPVTLVAFSGLLLGMLVMFVAGIHSDLKVRRILRDRLAEETREAKGWIDRNQRDLFAQDPEPASDPGPRLGAGSGPRPAPSSDTGPDLRSGAGPAVASDHGPMSDSGSEPASAPESRASAGEVPNPLLAPLPLPPAPGKVPDPHEDEEEGPETE
jgi:uncharacterized integral membrane protein